MMHPAEAFKPAPTDALITIGIDLSKDHLDAAHREQEQPRILVLAEETLGVAAGN